MTSSPLPQSASEGVARERELAGRRARLAAEVSGLDGDVLLATREGVVTYLSGFTTATWSNFSRPVIALLRTDGALAMVVAETEADAVRNQVPGAEVRTYVELRRAGGREGMPDGRVQFVPHAGEVLEALLSEWGVNRLLVDGLHAAFPPVAQPTDLLDPARYTFEDASELTWRHRLIKSDWEVARLREGCDVLARAFEGLRADLRPGMTEREIHGALAAHSFRAGADRLGYTNVVADVRCGLFGAPTDRRWEPGAVLYVDGGLIIDGYWADYCRMFVAGAPTPAQRDGYALAFGGLAAATAAIPEASTVGELGATIASACHLRPDEIGFGRFGHGIGLYMPEPPSLHPLDDTPLEDGLVLCIEPAVSSGGLNYVVEEEYVIRDGAPERLSPPAPSALIEVS
jgi:Xaa-Pro aminopeptidase